MRVCKGERLWVKGYREVCPFRLGFPRLTGTPSGYGLWVKSEVKICIYEKKAVILQPKGVNTYYNDIFTYASTGRVAGNLVRIIHMDT